MSERPTRPHLRPSPLSPILYPLSPFFHTLPHSFAQFSTQQNSTLFFSIDSALFAQNPRGWGSVDGETEDLMASLLNQTKIAYRQSSGGSLFHGPSGNEPQLAPKPNGGAGRQERLPFPSVASTA